MYVRGGSEFSERFVIISCVPQGSVLGLLFVNIAGNDLLLLVKESEVCSLTDDITVYASGKDVLSVTMNLEVELSNTLYWFTI